MPNSRHPIVSVEEVRKLVDGLGLNGTFDIADIAQTISSRTRRAVKVLPYPIEVVERFREEREALPYGVFMPSQNVDYVFFREDTSATHQRHIILHEFGHILCGHVGARLRYFSSEALVPILMRARSGLGEEQERAAELFAYLVQHSARPKKVASEGFAERYRILED